MCAAACSSRSSRPRSWARARASACRWSTASSSRAAGTSSCRASRARAVISACICRRSKRPRIHETAAPASPRAGRRARRRCCWSRTITTCASCSARRSSVTATGCCRRRRGRMRWSSSAIRQSAIDLLVTDAVLPELSGPSLAAHATRLRPGIRVLFISGYTDDAMLRLGRIEPQRSVPAEAVRIGSAAAEGASAAGRHARHLPRK